MSQQQMAMGGMAGGPVGGGGPGAQQQQMMNAGTPSSGDGGGIDAIKRLNTAIYDYLLRNSLYDAARSFVNKMDIETEDMKKSPNQRAQPNGVTDDGMTGDHVPAIKNRPDDLPAPSALGEGPFLQDWWCQFWETYAAYRSSGKRDPKLIQYIGAQRQAQKARTNMMAAGGMDAAGMQQMRFNNGAMMPAMNNGAAQIPNDLKRAAINNNRQNMTPHQQQMMMQQLQNKMQGGNQMERQGSQMDLSGPHSNSPGSGDAPSPKRQRLEGNMQQGRPGPPGQMPSNQVGLPPSTPQPNMPALDPARYAQTEQLLRQRGIDPAQLPPRELHLLAMQPANHQAKSIETYSASVGQSMKAAMNNTNKPGPPNPTAAMAAGQGSPMNPGMDATNEFYAAANANGRGAPMNPGMTIAGQGGNAAAAAGQAANSNGNHALQDYQMQLMLLEQQNKKRLLMARQEQDSMANPGMPGGGQFPTQAMSPGPQGDPSPNAGNMQRGTPKMNKGMSPNGDMAGRGSPQPGMMPNMLPPEMQRQMMTNGQMMRPPSSHPMGPGAPMSAEQMNLMRQAGQMIPNGGGQWPPGQAPPNMMPGQGPPNPNMTPRQQPMGPPPAPQAGTGPSSPAQPPAPPTPSQTNKPKPGGKKEGGKKGANKKGGQTGTAPATSEADAPTPTPATPITPFAANTFSHAQNKNLPNGQQAPNPQQQPPPNQAPPPNPPQQNAVQPPVPTDLQPFGSLDDGAFAMNMDFGPLDGGDVLDNFDFDEFLNNDGNGGLAGFDANFAFGGDALEADLTGGN